MKQLLSVTLVSLFALAVAGSGTAFAQDPCEGEGDEWADPCGDDGSDPCGGDVCGGDEYGDEGGEATEGGEEAAAEAGGHEGGWPLRIIDRPFVLPVGGYSAALGLSMNTDTTFDHLGAGIDVRYGVMDKLEVGLMYGFALNEFEIKGPLDVYVGYTVMEDDKLEVVANGSLGYNLLAEGLQPLTAGALVFYSLGENMGVFTPGRQLVVFMEEIGGGMGVDGIRPIFLQLPVAFHYQVNGNIFAEVETNLANIEISDAETQLIGADMLPLKVTGIYAIDNTMEAGLTLETELKDSAFDPLEILAVFRYYGGM